MTESQAVSKLIKKLSEHGHFWKSSDRFRAGVPDIVGCLAGRFAGVEAKIDYNTPSSIQVYTLCEIVKHGGYAGVVTYNNRNKKWWLAGKSYTISECVEEIVKCSSKGDNHIEN